MKGTVVSLILIASLAGTILGVGPPAQNPDASELKELLFPPNLVMNNQRVLNLTQEQRRYIVDQTRQAHSEFTGLSWDLRDEMDELRSLVEQKGVDEQTLLQQLDAVLDLEKQVKRAQLLLAVRIRNTLTAEQLKKLQQLRDRRGTGVRRTERRPFQQRP